MASTKAKIPTLGWSDARPAAVVLMSGPEQLLADRASARIRDLLRAEDPSLEVSEVDAADYATGELFSLASPSLFGEPRLIRVRNVEKCSDAFLADALQYLEAPDSGATLVLRHGGGVRGKRLLDAIRSGLGDGIEVACAELKRDQDRQDFVRAELRQAGKQVTPGAVRALVQAFGDDLAALDAACRQLAADAEADIDERVVDKYYGGRVETSAFRVADAALAGQSGQALVLLRHALASGADPVPIVAALASKVRTMAKVSGARGPVGAVASQLGFAPWMVERARKDLAGWAEEGLAASIEACAAADAAVKGAGRDPVYAVERLVAILAARGRG